MCTERCVYRTLTESQATTHYPGYLRYIRLSPAPRQQSPCISPFCSRLDISQSPTGFSLISGLSSAHLFFDNFINNTLQFGTSAIIMPYSFLGALKVFTYCSGMEGLNIHSVYPPFFVCHRGSMWRRGGDGGVYEMEPSSR